MVDRDFWVGNNTTKKENKVDREFWVGKEEKTSSKPLPTAQTTVSTVQPSATIQENPNRNSEIENRMAELNALMKETDTKIRRPGYTEAERADFQSQYKTYKDEYYKLKNELNAKIAPIVTDNTLKPNANVQITAGNQNKTLGDKAANFFKATLPTAVQDAWDDIKYPITGASAKQLLTESKLSPELLKQDAEIQLAKEDPTWRDYALIKPTKEIVKTYGMEDSNIKAISGNNTQLLKDLERAEKTYQASPIDATVANVGAAGMGILGDVAGFANMLGADKLPIVKNLTASVIDTADKLQANAQQYNVGTYGGYMGNLTQVITRMIPYFIAGTGKVVTEGGKAAKLIASTVNNPSFWISLTTIAGQKYNENMANGVNRWTATLNALTTAIPSALIEIAGGVGAKGKEAQSLLTTILEENFEEIAQGIVEKVSDKLTTKPDMKLYSTTEEAIINPKQMGEEVLYTTPATLLTGGTSRIIQNAQTAKANQEIADMRARYQTRQAMDEYKQTSPYSKYQPTQVDTNISTKDIKPRRGLPEGGKIYVDPQGVAVDSRNYVAPRQETIQTEEIKKKNELINKISNNTYLADEDKINLINQVNSTEYTEELVNGIEELLGNVNEELGLKNISNNFKDNKAKYGEYLRDTTEYDKTQIDNAKNSVAANKSGRRTKEQWLQVAKNLGSQIYEMSDAEIEKLAYKTWMDNKPNNKENLNRQGQKYVKFGLDEWVNTVYDEVKKYRAANPTQKVNNKLPTQAQNVKYSPVNAKQVLVNPKNTEVEKNVAPESPTNDFQEQGKQTILPTQKIQETVNSAKIVGMSDFDVKKATEIHKMLQSGTKLKFYDPQNIPEGVNPEKASRANGFYQDGVLWLNKNSDRKVQKIIGHELTHYLEDTQIYKDFSESILKSNLFYDYITSEGFDNVEQFKDNLRRRGYKDHELEYEMVSIFVEDNLFDSQEKINRLARENRTLAQKILNWLSDMKTKLVGTSQEKELLRIENMYRKALEQARNVDTTSTDAQYSYSGEVGLNNLKENRKNMNFAQRRFVNELESNYNTAVEMDKQGATNEQILKDTGWFKADGKWRWEIPDTLMTLKPDIQLENGVSYDLADILQHDLLFMVYPDLMTQQVVIDNDMNGKGKYNTITKNIKLKVADRSKGNIELTLLHEVQHAIQDTEGFEGGTSPLGGKLRYYEHKGEIEAADTARRLLQERQAMRKGENFDREKVAPELSKENPEHPGLKDYLASDKQTKIRDNIYKRLKGGAGNETESFDIEDVELENNETNNETLGQNNSRRRVAGREPAFSLPETDVKNYLEENSMELRTNGSLVANNLTDKQIKDLVKIYKANGYEDVSTDYLVGALQRGSAFIPREVADVFIEKQLGYKPQYDTTKIYEDAEGNKLTKEQVEFYKDSAVRDIRGRLIPVYHRTDSEFYTFDKNASARHGKKYGQGFYFSITPENYGNREMKVYLNAKEGEFKYVPKQGYYIVQEPNQIKDVTNTKPTSNPDIRFSLNDSEGRTLSKEQQEFFKDSKVRDAEGNLKPVYHGTKRADRVGYYFDPAKATSGPMAFFTDDVEIATNYSKSKQDTSISREADTEYDLFKVNGKDLDSYWDSLSPKQKRDIAEKGNNIGFDEDWENVVYGENASEESFGDQYKWRLNREYNGNAIKALYGIWIEDGNLMFEDMAKFKDILNMAGIENVEYLDKFKEEPKVYEVYMNLKNPFVTSDINQEIINKLQKASENATIGEQYTADSWDKSNIEPKDWMSMLRDDIKNNTTHSWTIIPDWVTDVLKSEGYDGIQDTGGKYSGLQHNVYIPFYSNQIKETSNTNPTENADIRYSIDGKEQIRTSKTKSSLLDEIAPINESKLEDVEEEKVANVLSRTPKTKAKDMLRQSKDVLMRKLVDAGHTIDTVGKITGDKNLYQYFNNTKQARQSAEYMIGEAQTDIQGNRVGNSLMRVFEPIRAKGDEYTNKFFEYLLHMHNIDRMKQNKPVFGKSVTAEDSSLYVKELLKEYPEFEKAANKVYAYNRNLMQWRVDSGLISQEQADIMNEMYPHYVPTFRNVSGTAGSRALQGGVQVANTVRKATGSNKDILPIDASMARQTMQTVQAAKRNLLGNRLLNDVLNNKEKVAEYVQAVEKTSEKTDLAEEMDNAKDSNLDLNNTFKIFRNGETYLMQVNNGIYEGLKSISSEIDNTDTNVLLKPVKAANNMFKKLITGYSPMFTIKNFARDIQDSGLYAKELRKFIKNYPKTYTEMLGDGKMWQLYKSLGGTGSSFFDYDSGIEKAIDSKNKLGTKIKESTVGKIEQLNMMIEQAPRFAEFMSTIEKAGNKNYDTLMEAMLNAADVTVNFGRSGTWGNFLNSTFVPFFNPSIQGFDKMGRTFLEGKAGKQFAKLAIRATLLGIAPTLINELLLGDDDDYENLSDRDKDTNFIIKLGDNKWLKIPKGRVLSIFGNTASRVLKTMRGEEWDVGEFVKNQLDQTAPISPFDSNIVSPIMAVQNNKTWYGSKIVPQRLEGYAPKDQYDEKTDVFSKWLGSKINYSPKKINYLIDAYTGIIGDVALPLSTPKAETNPFTKAFVIDGVTNNEISNDFYNMLDEYNPKQSNKESAKEVTRYLNKQSTQVSDINKQIREIENSGLSNAEKKKQVRELRELINTIELTAMATVPQYEKAVDKYKGTFADEEVDSDYAYLFANRDIFGAEYAVKTFSKSLYNNHKDENMEKFFRNYFTREYFQKKLEPEKKSTNALPTLSNKTTNTRQLPKLSNNQNKQLPKLQK